MPSPKLPFGIRKLTIENFRRIEHLELDLRGVDESASEIIVFAGPNGSGKTTVLEACLLAVGYEGEFRGPVDHTAVRAGSATWRITAELETPHAVLRVSRQLNAEAQWWRIDRDHESLPCAFPTIYFSSWRSPKLVGALPISAGRSGRRPDDNEQNRIWRLKQHLINEKAHALMSSKGGPQRLLLSDLKDLNELWKEFYPRAGTQFEVHPISESSDDGFDVFLTESENHQVPIDALSSGQLELLSLIGGLMLANFDEGIIVIDEPELHLDPQWHGMLLRVIRKLLPKTQLIVATHSPRVYDSVLSFQRFLLVDDDDPRAKVWNDSAAEV